MDMPRSARELLASEGWAQLVTLNADGSPHVTAAWVGLEADDVVIATLGDQRKLRNIRRDPRVALTVPTSVMNPIGLTEYLVLYGTARITEGGAPEKLQE